MSITETSDQEAETSLVAETPLITTGEIVGVVAAILGAASAIAGAIILLVLMVKWGVSA
jgi:hypothetical protein